MISSLSVEVSTVVERAGMEGIVHSCQTSETADSKYIDPVQWIVIFFHLFTYFYTDIVHYQHYRRIKQLYLVDDNPLLMWLSNFTFSVDTFFHISGVLLIYSSWKKMTSNDGRISVLLEHRKDKKKNRETLD